MNLIDVIWNVMEVKFAESKFSIPNFALDISDLSLKQIGEDRELKFTGLLSLASWRQKGHPT